MPSSFSARCRPTKARWLNERSLRPPMSVTSPTLMGLPLAGAEPDVELELVLLLSLEPHQGTASASAAHPPSAVARSFIFTVLSSSGPLVGGETTTCLLAHVAKI